MDIKQARKNVIEQQIRPWGGLNIRANQALIDIPRENFVPEEYQNLVFADMEIPLTNSEKMLSPKIE
jgi:protein-L-isoaspartate(D-aspartate) O-methyltransferase